MAGNDNMLDSMLEGFGIASDDTSDEDSSTTSVEETNTSQDEGTTDTSTEDNSSGSDDSATDTQNVQGNEPQLSEKQANAFAALRTQNAQKDALLKSLATALDIDTSNADQMYTALNERVLQLKSKQQNVPVELLRQVQEGQDAIAQLRRDQYQRDTALGFQKLQQDYNLTQADLNNFASELLQKGHNPFTSSVDVVEMYKILHFNDILEKAKADAVREEQERANHARTKGTTPSSTQGTGTNDDSGKTITTQDGLTNLFASNK